MNFLIKKSFWYDVFEINQPWLDPRERWWNFYHIYDVIILVYMQCVFQFFWFTQIRLSDWLASSFYDKFFLIIWVAFLSFIIAFLFSFVVTFFVNFFLTIQDMKEEGIFYE